MLEMLSEKVLGLRESEHVDNLILSESSTDIEDSFIGDGPITDEKVVKSIETIPEDNTPLVEPTEEDIKAANIKITDTDEELINQEV